jgi:hypothetical protein
MNLISFRGMNCYQSCVISLAHHWEVDYPLAFSTLWSETDFLYEDYFQIYSSRRMLINLETLGIRMQCMPVESREQTMGRLNTLSIGEFAVIGTDAFATPWSPVYTLSHETHYFIVRKEAGDMLTCFDPSYGEKDARMTLADTVPYIFDLRFPKPSKKKPLHMTAAQEARAIVREYSEIRQGIVARIEACVTSEELLGTGRFIDAMMNNRSLFQHYLNTVSFAGEPFNDARLLRWKSLKNGLFKASLIKKKEKTIAEVVSRFQGLMDEELEIAMMILKE